MRKLFLCLSLIAASLVASSVEALFVSDQAKWNLLPLEGKVAFAMGAFDKIMVVSAGDPYQAADARAISACARDTGLNGKLMADMIDRYYDDHAEQRGQPPANVLLMALTGLCKPLINQERESKRLKPVR